MSDDKPSNIMQITQLLLALGALGIGGGSWFQETDTTAVETGHALHEAEMMQMQAVMLRQHTDLKNLYAFVEGYVTEQEAEREAQEAAQPRRRGRAQKKRVRHAPKLPSMSDAPVAMEHPDFGEALDMSDSELAEALRELHEAEEQMEEPPPTFNYQQAIEEEFGGPPPPPPFP